MRTWKWEAGCFFRGSRSKLSPTLVVFFLIATTLPGEAYDVGEFLQPIGKVRGKLDNLKKKYRRMREEGRKDWHYGAYLDVGYLPNLSHPDADQWRSKTTDFKLNRPEVNMATAYVRKEVNPGGSRWGGEFAVQTGVDSEGLDLKTGTNTIPGADTLRHFSRANLSYLFPVGKGLKLTGGLMNSYIGYSSFHAKDNANYTRGYLLDNVPYFLFGLEALYPATDALTVGVYTLSGFTYLTRPNNIPSFGVHTVWEANSAFTIIQNLYYGSDQANEELQFWRFFSDSIVEWKGEKWSLAAAYDVGTEKQASVPGNPRYVWMSGAIWASRHLIGPWWLGIRPEFYWDPDGLITGAEQLIWATTGTLAYRVKLASKVSTTVKLEYRFDRSTGSGGGFFTGQNLSSGVTQLTPNQQLLILGLMVAFDS